MKPLGFLVLRGGGSSCSSITSTNSSSLGAGGGGLLIVVSSTTMVSLLLEFLRGGGVRVRSRRTSSITCSLSTDTLDATTVLRGDDLRGEDLRGEDRREGALREGDRERRRMTSSSTTDELPWAPPPRPKHVYISQRIRRKAATEPKTMPTISPGEGPELRPV